MRLLNDEAAYIIHEPSMLHKQEETSEVSWKESVSYFSFLVRHTIRYITRSHSISQEYTPLLNTINEIYQELT